GPRLVACALLPARPAGHEAVGHPRHHGIEGGALRGGIDHGERADEPAAAGEYGLFIEGLALAVSRQHQPIVSQRSVADLEAGVGRTREKILVALSTVAVAVGQRPDQQARLTIAGHKHAPVAGLRGALKAEEVGGILETEAEAFVLVAHPLARRRLA